ncbi:tetratricopeptide repeat protein [Actinacidiphila acidipaludis]|uniref:ATP-binding protein n=1 Tax=Actinacidiphila acidipaludis TaxID=2873382 RepID=A0ABS7QCY3_9ACTN|nr:ABC transporter ATP-binding protein [Streptomyces acidipaludis]MBY8879629.1 ATP-binding protein [Streptomyces acidipaludis]
MEQHSGRPGGDAIAAEAAGEPVEPFALPVFPGSAESEPEPDPDEPVAGKVVDLRDSRRGDRDSRLPALPGSGEGRGGSAGATGKVRRLGDGTPDGTAGAPADRASGAGGTTAPRPGGTSAGTDGGGSFGALPALPQRTPLPQRSPLPVRPIAETHDGTAFDAFGVSVNGPAAAPRPAQDRNLGSFTSLGGSGSFDGFAAGSPAPRSDARPLPAGTDGTETSPEQDGAEFDGAPAAPRTSRPPRDPLGAPEQTTPTGGNARVARVVTTDFLLTVNPVDGTEVVTCPPDEKRTPVRRTLQDRIARMNSARPSPPPGPPAPELPLLERDDERERLIRLLARGRSVRVTGPSGAGRSSLLDAVAGACGELAPDGVLRLSGYRRTAADLLQDLYAVVHAGEGYRPSREELSALLGSVGAVVVLDDLEIGGSALEEVLAAAPECAFLMSATPEVPAPAADSAVEEVFLSGLSRSACLDLLALSAGRRLAEDESAWAADLWFESEGLPLRFVQAGALLRQRDAARLPAEPAEWDDSVWDNGAPGAQPPIGLDIPDLTGFDAPDGTAFEPAAVPETTPTARTAGAPGPLPSLAESAAPADLLASRLSEAAREALAFAVALDGECPHPSHLPALVGDTHGDAALGELTSVGLAVPVAGHFRLAAGVTQQLAASLRADGELSDTQAHTAALHYTWWAGHPSVTPERAAGESEAILAAMAACRDGGNADDAVQLARTAAPVFAAALHWGAWERALRIGQEAARISGDVAEEAYFHHELGVLALCTGHPDRARAELEASIALRRALADRKGTVVGRRTLALVADREGTQAAAPFDGDFGPEPAAASTVTLPPVAEPPTVVIGTPKPTPLGAGGKDPVHARRVPAGRRRNLIAAGAGALVVAAIGAIVAVGASGGKGGSTPNQVQPIESVEQDGPSDSAAPPEDGTTAPAATSAAATTATTSNSTSTSPSSTPSTAQSAATSGTTSTPPTTPSRPSSGTGGTTGHTTTGGAGSSTGGSTSGGSSGGSSSGGTGSGGTSTGGSTGTPSGGSTGTPTGGSTGSPTGGSTGTPTGGSTGSTTGSPDGGSTGSPTGGSTGTTSSGSSTSTGTGGT